MYTVVDEKPALDDLKYMSIAGGDGLIEHLQVRWRSLAIALKFPLHSIEAIERNKNPIYQLLSECMVAGSQNEGRHKTINLEDTLRPYMRPKFMKRLTP